MVRLVDGKGTDFGEYSLSTLNDIIYVGFSIFIPCWPDNYMSPLSP